MTAVDTNILVYAHRLDSPWHRQALACLRSLAEAPSAWAIPWPCVHEFLSIVTHPRIFRVPTPPGKAMADLDELLRSPSVHLIGESESHWATLSDLAAKGSVTGPVFHDARIAAVCLSHGVSILLTADRDFGRFPDLAIQNPLVASAS